MLEVIKSYLLETLEEAYKPLTTGLDEVWNFNEKN